jgi:lysozyme
MSMRSPKSILGRSYLIVGGFLLLALALWMIARSWHPSDADYPVQGIDVSHHQGTINWNEARADGVNFAYLKASEGADLRDPLFAENWDGTAKAGVRRGAYHFFTLCRLARDQATNFISVVPREAGALPPALDLEFGGNCSSRPSRAVLLAELAVFIKMVEAHSEQPVVLYLTKEFDEQYQISSSINRPLWLRSLFFPPVYGNHPWVMWQASNLRSVDGISGRVDWNVVRP